MDGLAENQIMVHVYVITIEIFAENKKLSYKHRFIVYRPYRYGEVLL